MREKVMTSNVNVLQDSLVHNVKKVRKLIPITVRQLEVNILENTICNGVRNIFSAAAHIRVHSNHFHHIE